MRSLAPAHRGRLSRLEQGPATTRVPHVSAAPVRRAATAEMRYFLDSADAGAWTDFLPTGIFYGVTTNPVILQRDGVQCTRQALQVSSAARQPCYCWRSVGRQHASNLLSSWTVTRTPYRTSRIELPISGCRSYKYRLGVKTGGVWRTTALRLRTSILQAMMA